MQTIQEIFAVGNYQQLKPDNAFQGKLLRILKTYAWVFVAMIAIAPILVLADKFVTEVLHHKSLNDVNKQQFQQFYKKLGKIGAIVFICLIGPIFEELIFRFGLKFKKRDVFISIFVAIFYFGSAIIRKIVPGIQVLTFIEIELISIIAGVILLFYFVPDTSYMLTDQLRFRFTILSMLLFGLMHAFNFRPMEWGIIWIYPIYVLPQLLMGWGVTYVRLKNGFVWGIALHCLINTVSTLLTLGVKGY